MKKRAFYLPHFRLVDKENLTNSMFYLVYGTVMGSSKDFHFGYYNPLMKQADM